MSVKTCEQCGKPIPILPNISAKRMAERKFCDKHCRSASLRGKPSNNAGKGKVNRGPCAVEGCSNKARSRGWCRHHYNRWKRYGDPTGEPQERAPREPAEEPAVSLRPGRSGVTCPDCGRVYSATTDPVLAACALDNHHYYCKAKKKETAA